MNHSTPIAPTRSGRRAPIRPLACGALAVLLAHAPSLAAAAQGNGLTKPVILPAFDPTKPNCTKPSGLRRELVFVQDNDREFVQGIGRGLAAAASDRRLAYRGQIDGSRPGNGVAVDGRDLRAAMDALLKGARPAAEQRPSTGCNIKWKAGKQPVYYHRALVNKK